ncbi:hypothetical protein QR680_015731 [Steinernema hermaphroditum]|uniref:DUF5641 domain-containing protein n=1 Tax=Steinernema hermaphroditum TaxID=289476 RepID=A0AA39HAY3_9BILA|nr:hypothetical protein QR680_015731 [Steinernema hermaphroditum]
MEDEYQPRRNWKLGKIIDKKIGSDGNVREVTLMLGNHETVKRPVNRLIPLEIGEEEQESDIEPVEEEKEENELTEAITNEPGKKGDKDLINDKNNHRYNLRPRKKIDYARKF